MVRGALPLFWSARSTEEFDFQHFNAGDYIQAVSEKQNTETISKVLYPNDKSTQGRELRLKQEYFFTSASIKDLLRRFIAEGYDLAELDQQVAIQLNDTHPAIAGPELVRILVDEHGIAMTKAIDKVSLELEWPEDVFSLSHIAIPFPPDDPLYGDGLHREPGSFLTYGNLASRGEKGLLSITAELLMRLRYNPFFPFVEQKLDEWVEQEG